MATETMTSPEKDKAIEKKIQQFRDLFADAPELGKTALENVLREIQQDVSDPPKPIESAGRVGARLGKVSELTIIVPLAPGGGQAAAYVPAAVARQSRARRGQGGQPARHALRVL